MNAKDRLYQFPFFPADFLVSTMLMKPDQRGAYITLLCHAWIEDGLEDNEELLCQLAGLKPAKMKEVLKRFARDSDGKLRHPRMEQVRQEVLALRDKRAKAGRKGAEVKWQSHSKATSLPMANQCDPIASKAKEKKTNKTSPQRGSPLSTADRIGLEHAQKLLAEEIKSILNGRCIDATGDVISWNRQDDPDRLRELREKEREIKSTLMSFSPREQQQADIPPGIAGIAELLARGKKAS